MSQKNEGQHDKIQREHKEEIHFQSIVAHERFKDPHWFTRIMRIVRFGPDMEKES